MHWGGGTPTYLDKAQVSHLVWFIEKAFSFADDVEMSIEVEARVKVNWI